MIRTWTTSFLSFSNTRILAIFLFGFSSGLPFSLTLSTLSVWLKESGVSNTTIGFFVVVTLPYSFKFFLGPFVDQVPVPFLSSQLGQRRAWALMAQGGLVMTLLGLSQTQPESNVLWTALWALGVAICSTIQDISLEAYRIESVGEEKQGAAASAMTLGWRLGMMTSGVGTLFLATFVSWKTSYEMMALLMGVGILTTLLSPSPPQVNKSQNPSRNRSSTSYFAPFKSLLSSLDWPRVLLFILFFKLGDTVLSVMSIPFLVEIGFAKLEIMHTTKIFGITAMIAGGILGGIYLSRFGLRASLVLATFLQCLASLLFVMQSFLGHNVSFFVFVVGVENISGGFCTAALLLYFSRFCRFPDTATHFAILSSFGSFVRVFLSIGAGILADYTPWFLFFILTAMGSLPCFYFLRKEGSEE